MSNRATAPDAVGALTMLNRRSPAPIFVDRGGGRYRRRRRPRSGRSV